MPSRPEPVDGATGGARDAGGARGVGAHVGGGGADDREQVVARVVAAARGLVRELVTDPATDPAASAAVHADSHLTADLELDSLGVVELVDRVERATGRSIADERLVDLHTLRDLADVLGDDHPGPAGARAVSSAAAHREGAAQRRLEADAAEDAHAELPTRPSRFAGVYALLVFAVVAAVVWPVLAVLPGFERRWRVVRGAGHAMFAATGSRLEVHAPEPLPDRPYIVVANHASFIDPLLLAMALPPPLIFTAVQGLEQNRLVGRFLTWMRCYPVLPGDRARARRAVADLAGVVRAGWPIVLFPEGRRSERVGLEAFHLGAFRVAAETGAPVLAVTIRGARALLPVGRSLPARGPVQVIVGGPLVATSPDFAGAVDLRARVRAQVLRELGEPDLAGSGMRG